MSIFAFLIMCFSYAVNINPADLKSKLNIKDIPTVTQGFFFNGFEHPDLPIILIKDNDIQIQNAQWGLIPEWTPNEHKAKEFQNISLNARSETAFEKPVFRNAWEQHPCVVIASGFFEWKHVNKTKIPHYIQSSNDNFLWMAGIYDHWTNVETGEIITSFSILTTRANSLMSDIHNSKFRMPVVLDHNHLIPWLNSNISDRSYFCKPCEDEALKAFTVSSQISNPKINRNQPWAVQPANYANQNTLF